MADYYEGKQRSFEEHRQRILASASPSPDFAGLLRSRATPGGLEYIKGCIEQGLVSDIGNSILLDLLERNNLHLSGDDIDTATGPLLSSLKPRLPTRSNNGLSDEEAIQMGKRGELSLFVSILHHFEDTAESAPVLGKAMIKSCLCTVPPHAVPASMDAKEMVMAAIHFLSQKYGNMLPLIESIPSDQGDLEKQKYTKVGDWRLEDVIDDVVAIEDVFLRDASSYQWMPRGYFVPKIADGHDVLLQKGTAPSSLLRKRKAAPRKTAAATASKKKQAVEPSLTELTSSDTPLSSRTIANPTQQSASTTITFSPVNRGTPSSIRSLHHDDDEIESDAIEKED